MKITSFANDFGKDNSKWSEFRKDVEIALRTVCDKYNIDVKTGHARYSSISAELDLTFTTKNTEGGSIDLEAEEFKRYAKRYGFSPDDLGKKFFLSGEIYQITGMTKTKSKYPILAKNLTKKKDYKLAIQTVLKGLENAKSLGAVTDSEKMAKLSKSGLFDK